MLPKISPEKIVYSKEPDDSLAYTEKLDQAYAKYARLYDQALKILPVWKTWIKAVLPHIQGERVLEASFGTGYLLLQYAAYYETYGIDYNKEMIAVAQKNLAAKGVPATLAWANVEKLPYPDNHFDTIVNTMAFSGYPNGQKAMAEFYRVLKDDGRLLMIDFDYPADRNILGYLLTKLMELAGDTIRDISKMLQAFNFEYVEKEIGGFGSIHFYIAQKPAAQNG